MIKNLAEFKKLKQNLPQKECAKKPCAIAQMLHDLGLAVWFGGSLMGILAVNPAVEVLDDPEERGKMVDEAWARFQPYGALGLLTAFVTHISLRRRGPKNASSCYKKVAMLKDFALLGACASSLASLALGEYTVGAEPDSYTPSENGDESGGSAASEGSKAPGGLTLAAWGQIASGLTLFACSAYLITKRDKS